MPVERLDGSSGAACPTVLKDDSPVVEGLDR